VNHSRFNCLYQILETKTTYNSNSFKILFFFLSKFKLYFLVNRFVNALYVTLQKNSCFYISWTRRYEQTSLSSSNVISKLWMRSLHASDIILKSPNANVNIFYKQVVRINNFIKFSFMNSQWFKPQPIYNSIKNVWKKGSFHSILYFVMMERLYYEGSWDYDRKRFRKHKIII
jgi:hypothetical protein